MRVQLVSDPHLNKNMTWSVLNPNADVFVIAGDLASSPEAAKEFLTKLRIQTHIPVVYVLGNHEYYGQNLYTAVNKYKAAVKDIDAVHVLEREAIDIHGVNFLGCTLWSDLSDPLAALAVKHALNDYSFIERQQGVYITPSDTHAEYLLSLQWLKTTLADHAGEQNVVVTHHAPMWGCRNTYFDYDYNGRLVTCGFCSRLNTVIQTHDIDTWMYGHTHKSKTLRLGGTQVVSNQLGLEHEKKHSGFDRYKLINL